MGFGWVHRATTGVRATFRGCALTKRIGCQDDRGNRLCKVQCYGNDKLLILKSPASLPTVGSSVELHRGRREQSRHEKQ